MKYGHTYIKFKMPDQYYEQYRTFIDKYRTVHHIDRGIDFDDLNSSIIIIGFRPISNNEFIEKIIILIDHICDGLIEVIKYYSKEEDRFLW